MKILVSAIIFRKVVAIIKRIMIGMVVIVICLFIYEELVGPAIAYIFERTQDYAGKLEGGNNHSLSELPISDSLELVKGVPIDIFDISKFELIQLTKKEYGGVLSIKNGVQREVTYDGQEVRYLQFSPTQDKLGFYYYPDGNTLQDIVLVIMDISKRTSMEVYRGSIRTSGWEWFSNNEVLVQYNCGTECQIFYLININSSTRYTLQYGVGYEWSPNQQIVLAYRYSGRPGITIGDKLGKVLFDFLREPSNVYSKLIEQTKALWSPDNSKVALLIKKEKEEAMEIIVFNIKQEFKQIFQDDLTGEGRDIEFYWQEKGSLVFKDLNGEREVVF